MKLTYISTMLRDFGSDLVSQVGGAIGGALGTLTGGLAGMAFQGEQNRNQISQQQKLTDMQLQANEKLSSYNFQQQMQMWENTNYPAQVQQLEKAGLNPGLLYHSAGGQPTMGSPSGGIGMGIAPSGNAVAQGMANGAASIEAAADVRLKNAQAASIEAQTPQQADLMKAQIDSITQGINNAKATEALTDAQAQTQRLQNSIQGETLDDQIATIRATAGSIEAEMQRAVRQNNLDAATYADKAKTIQGIMIATFLQNNLTKAQTAATQANTKLAQANTMLSYEQIQQIIQDVQIKWKQLDINKQNANTQEAQMKIQQFVNDVTHGQAIIAQGLIRLIPNIVF